MDNRELPKDVTGETVSVGDTITYPVRHGSWMTTRVAQVAEINLVERNVWGKPVFVAKVDVDMTNWKGEKQGTRRVSFYSFDRCTKVRPSIQKLMCPYANERHVGRAA